MAHMIEEAKSGRASCRTCKQTIAKGELRLGEEVPNAFAEGEMTYHWHHPVCAAKKKPAALKQALEATTLDIPNKEELLQTIESSGKTEKPSSFPYAEQAPTSRSSCISCGEKIEKGDLRVAVETEVNTGSFSRKGAGYLHPACSIDHTEDADLFDKVKANSLNLSPSEMETLEEEMNG
jgi:poly [ADP-ribose] polymerase